MTGAGASRTRPAAPPEGCPSVTVVVPTRNSARTLAACLRSVCQQTHPCRVVVVDNGSTDDTRVIADQWADVVLSAGPERSAQRNLGAHRFPADVVGFIDSDMVLDPAVVEQAAGRIAAGAGAVIVPECTTGEGFWAQVRAFERSFYDGADAVEAARFFRWDVFDRSGGFDEELTGPEDWDLTETVRALGPVVRIPAMIDHDEGRVRYLDACRKKAYYAEGVRRYIAKRGLGSLTHVTGRPWLLHPRRLVCRHGAGLLALKAGEAAAMGLALGRAMARRGEGSGAAGPATIGEPTKGNTVALRPGTTRRSQ